VGKEQLLEIMESGKDVRNVMEQAVLSDQNARKYLLVFLLNF
jgi:hypothetical protein